jgi:hypothetical protein
MPDDSRGQRVPCLRSDVRTGPSSVPVYRGAPDQHRLGPAPECHLVAGSHHSPGNTAGPLPGGAAARVHAFVRCLGGRNQVRSVRYPLGWRRSRKHPVAVQHRREDRLQGRVRGRQKRVGGCGGTGRARYQCRSLPGGPIRGAVVAYERSDRGWRTWRSGSCSCSLPMCTTTS